MAVRKVKCGTCGTSFQPKRSTAKFCKPACREKARRQRVAAIKAKPAPKRLAKKVPVAKKAAPRPSAKKAPAAPRSRTPVIDKHDLVRVVRKELEVAGKLETFDGQLALQLARRMANPDESGITALARELRAAMAMALGSRPAPASAGETEPEDDEVTRARNQREEARKAAGLA